MKLPLSALSAIRRFSPLWENAAVTIVENKLTVCTPLCQLTLLLPAAVTQDMRAEGEEATKLLAGEDVELKPGRLSIWHEPIISKIKTVLWPALHSTYEMANRNSFPAQSNQYQLRQILLAQAQDVLRVCATDGVNAVIFNASVLKSKNISEFSSFVIPPVLLKAVMDLTTTAPAQGHLDDDAAVVISQRKGQHEIVEIDIGSVVGLVLAFPLISPTVGEFPTLNKFEFFEANKVGFAKVKAQELVELLDLALEQNIGYGGGLMFQRSQLAPAHQPIRLAIADGLTVMSARSEKEVIKIGTIKGEISGHGAVWCNGKVLRRVLSKSGEIMLEFGATGKDPFCVCCGNVKDIIAPQWLPELEALI